MSQKYHLPCPACGTKHVVDVTRLGVPFACSCGKPDLEVASLRDLRKLEPVDDPSAKRETPWGPRQGLMLLGGVVFIAAAIATVVIYTGIDRHKVRIVPADETAKQVADATLQQTFDMWRLMRSTSLEDYTSEAERSQEREMMMYQYNVASLRRWSVVFGGIAIVGLIVHIIGWTIPPAGAPVSSAPRRKKPASASA